MSIPVLAARARLLEVHASSLGPHDLEIFGREVYQDVIVMRWIVGPDDGCTVREILIQANADSDALRDGRVFVGLQRVRRDDERVRQGDVVEVSPRRLPQTEPLRVLAQTHDLVAVDKPAGIPTIADHAGAAHALLALVARALGIGERSLHATSRLDRDVSGVVVFARTAAAAQRLKQARTTEAYERRYVAIAANAPRADHGTWNSSIGRARDPRLRAIAGRNAIDATTHYALCARAQPETALLALSPITGRTHQIRLHAAHAGAPLVGDRHYGGPSRLSLASGRTLELRRIALHATRIVVPDERGVRLVVEASVPADLVDLWSALGGDAAAWEVATSCALG